MDNADNKNIVQKYLSLSLEEREKKLCLYSVVDLSPLKTEIHPWQHSIWTHKST